MIMRSLSIVSTQMQLLNCIEYITLNNISSNHLILFALSPSRYSQLNDILEVSCNKNIFDKITPFVFGKIKLLNFSKAIFLYLYILLLSFKKEYKVCIVGNYRVSYGRKFWALRPDVEKIAVDDGAATVTWFKVRNEELKTRVPQLFYTTRLLRVILQNKRDMIPDNVKFFSIYHSLLPSSDIIINNSYKYLRSNIKSYSNSSSILSRRFIFLGQPLYLHDIISIENYNAYLLKMYETVGRDFVYYPHPEEYNDTWMCDAVKSHYKYVENHFSFEIYALMAEKPLTIVGFFTSALTVIKDLRPNFDIISIKFSEISKLNKKYAGELENVYKYFDESGIQIISM